MRFSLLTKSSIALVALASLTLPLVPAHANPGDTSSVSEQRKTVDELYREATVASENYLALKVELDELRAEINTLQLDLTRAEELSASLEAEVVQSMVSSYEDGGSLDGTVKAFSTGSTSEFLSQSSTLQLVESSLEAKVSAYDVSAAELELRQDSLAAQLEGLEDLEAQMSEEADKLTRAHGEAEAELKLLRDEAREEARRAAEEEAAEELASLMASRSAVVSRDGERESQEEEEVPTESAPQAEEVKVASPPDPNLKGVEAVLAFARSQLGDAYVYGASGPDAWDCSGYTAAAWRSAGVSLPHSSRVQSTMGSAVSRDQLQPGDLVFYYSPVSHVGIYAGNGIVLHAANPGTGVASAPVFSMPFHSARRVG